MDDCSNDGTTEIIKNLENATQNLFVKHKNQGKELPSKLRHSKNGHILIQDADQSRIHLIMMNY